MKLDCVVCQDRYKDPRFLQCGHSFCLGCLTDWFARDSASALPCPTCRQETNIPFGGCSHLPRNYALNDALESPASVSAPAPALIPRPPPVHRPSSYRYLSVKAKNLAKLIRSRSSPTLFMSVIFSLFCVCDRAEVILFLALVTSFAFQIRSIVSSTTGTGAIVLIEIWILICSSVLWVLLASMLIIMGGKTLVITFHSSVFYSSVSVLSFGLAKLPAEIYRSLDVLASGGEYPLYITINIASLIYENMWYVSRFATEYAQIAFELVFNALGTTLSILFEIIYIISATLLHMFHVGIVYVPTMLQILYDVTLYIILPLWSLLVTLVSYTPTLTQSFFNFVFYIFGHLPSLAYIGFSGFVEFIRWIVGMYNFVLSTYTVAKTLLVAIFFSVMIRYGN